MPPLSRLLVAALALMLAAPAAEAGPCASCAPEAPSGWWDDRALAAGELADEAPRIDVDGTGLVSRAAIAWERRGSGDGDIRLALSDDGGCSWSQSSLTTGPQDSRLPDVAVSLVRDMVAVAFVRDGAVVATTSTDGGRTLLERIRRGEMKGRPMGLVVSHFAPGGSGTISILTDSDGDGVAEGRRDIVTGLPSDGLNGNQQPAAGPDGRIYFGQGARTNTGIPAGGGPADAPENGCILRVQPDGSDLEIVACGMRNAFDLAFTPDGELFATDNGPDASGPGPVSGAPDELNSIVMGEHYGWPAQRGFPPERTGTIGPVATFTESSSTDGLALVTPGTLCGHEGDLLAA